LKPTIQKEAMRYLIFLLTTSLLLLNMACTYDGFTRGESQYIDEKPLANAMRLFTIDSPSDSLLLKQKARKVKEKHIGTETLHKLHQRMLATVTDSTNEGVGIAAPQVGIAIRMILVQRFDEEGEPFEVYFNPEILPTSDSVAIGKEGCLSVPGYISLVSRCHQISIKYLDSLGKKQQEVIEGFTAVIFQHETDHLNGILYYERIDNGFTALTKLEE
jgi:peptide deformylase